MDREIILRVLKQKNAKEGQPDEWLNMQEIYHKVGYNYPYSRWAKGLFKKWGVAPKTVNRKSGGRGRPFIIYYIPVSNSEEILGAIERRKHVRFTFMRVIKDAESSNEEQ